MRRRCARTFFYPRARSPSTLYNVNHNSVAATSIESALRSPTMQIFMSPLIKSLFAWIGLIVQLGLFAQTAEFTMDGREINL